MKKAAKPSERSPEREQSRACARTHEETPRTTVGSRDASDTSALPPDYLQQLFAPWTAIAGMWTAWLQTTEVFSHERGLETTKLLTRFWDPEFWKAGGLAPLVAEMQQVMSLPRFADVPAVDLSAFRSSASALDLMATAQQFLSVSIPLWMAISKNFQAEISARAHNGQDVRTPGEALDLWNNVVDRTLMEFNRSSDFAQLQQRLLRALTQYRLDLRKLGERTSQLLDMPTRCEMTDVYRRMHGMQRELQALRRELRTLRRGSEPKTRNRSGK
jgi:hypothetical protein